MPLSKFLSNLCWNLSVVPINFVAYKDQLDGFCHAEKPITTNLQEPSKLYC